MQNTRVKTIREIEKLHQLGLFAIGGVPGLYLRVTNSGKYYGSVEKVRVTADQTAGAWPKILPIRNMKKAGSPTPLTKERKALMSEFMDSAAALVERATK